MSTGTPEQWKTFNHTHARGHAPTSPDLSQILHSFIHTPIDPSWGSPTSGVRATHPMKACRSTPPSTIRADNMQKVPLGQIPTTGASCVGNAGMLWHLVRASQKRTRYPTRDSRGWLQPETRPNTPFCSS